jgi:hypothetical protein
MQLFESLQPIVRCLLVFDPVLNKPPDEALMLES